MKRCLLFIFLLFVSIVDVNAVSYNLNYDINSFDIDGSSLKIKGWSIVDHADNVGVTSKDGGVEEHAAGSNKFKTGSLRTYVVAYVLDSNQSWDDIVGNSYGNLKSCHSKGRCLVFGTTATTANYYFSRCTGEEKGMACFKSVRDNREAKVASGAARYKNGDCAYEKGVYKGKSHCLYKNVGFSKTINLGNAYKHFISFSKTTGKKYSKIYFRIFSVVSVKNQDTGKYYFIPRSSLLEIPNYSIDSSLRNKLTAGSLTGYKKLGANIRFSIGETTYKVNSIEFKMGSDKVKVTAVNGLVSTNSTTNNKSVYIQHNQNFKIDTSSRTGYTYGRSNSAFTFKKGDGSYTARFYAVRACICDKKKRNGKDYICAGNSTDSVKCINSTYKTYYVPAVWSLPTGGFVLKTTWEKEENYQCVKCEGNKCSLSEDTCKKITEDFGKCDVEQIEGDCKKSVTYDLKTNDDSESKCERTISSPVKEKKNGQYVYYYAIEKDNLDSILKDSDTEAKNATLNGATNFRLKLESEDFNVYEGTFNGIDYYYIPVELHAVVNYSQLAKFDIYKVGPDGDSLISLTSEQLLDEEGGLEVKSGRFFDFAFKTDVTAKWQPAVYNGAHNSYINWYTNVVEVYYKYKKKNASNYTISKNPIKLQFNLKNGSNVWYNSKMKIEPNIGVDTRIRGIVNAYSHLVRNYNHFENTTSDFGVDVSFFDSNEYVRDVDVYSSSPGNFVCNPIIKNKTDGVVTEISKSCNYTIPQAYINPVNGYVYYNEDESYNKMINVGSLYYIPYSMKTGEIFKFKINIDNLSLLSGVTNTYSDAVCQVKAISEKDKLKYRPINTSIPFPKADVTYSNIANNWKKYYDEFYSDAAYKNFSRIKNNSYSNIAYRTLFFENSIINRISNLNSNYGGYGDNGDMTVDGESNVIKNENIFEIDNGKHCASAKYDVSCDEVQ